VLGAWWATVYQKRAAAATTADLAVAAGCAGGYSDAAGALLSPRFKIDPEALMRASRATVWTVAAAGCLLSAVAARGQSSDSDDPPRRERRTVSEPRSEGVSRPPIQREPVPLPERNPPPLGSTDRLPNAPPARGRDRRPEESADRDPIDHARNLADDSRRRHGLGGSDGTNPPGGDDGARRYPPRVPPYYDPWGYDRNRYWDDGDRGYDPEPLDGPRDRRRRDDDDDDARPDDGPLPPGALLPPEGMIDDEDAPAPLKKALDASPPYREATAQLLRAWATYARAAEQVVQRLRKTAPYRQAMAQLRGAEARVEMIRAREAGAPAVRLVGAAQEAMLARRAVRRLEEQAINADPVARRAKQDVDQAIERRNKIRDDIASKLPGAGVPDAAQKGE
jgi:hypothetical protein